jgi:glycosyltransferase involved in cell wall biosynthesis
MNVLLDVRFLEKSGIGRSIEHLVQSLARSPLDIHMVLAGQMDAINRAIASSHEARRAVVGVVPFNTPIYSVQELVSGSLLARRFDWVDVMHFPQFNAPIWFPRRSVVTVHDLIHFRFRRFFHPVKVLAAQRVLQNALYRAGRVICVSRSAQQDTVRAFPEIQSKTRVVYGAVAGFQPATEETIAAARQRYGLSRYLIYVGNRKPHKNLGRLIQAYAVLLETYPDLQLIVCGRRSAAVDELDKERRRLGLRGIVELTGAGDDEIMALYSGAIGAVLPSLYEGFGRTPLEAMACGTPVAVSRVASIPEIVGDAGLYFNPYDVADMVRSLHTLVGNEMERRRILALAPARVAAFSLDRLARETYAVYEEAARL